MKKIIIFIVMFISFCNISFAKDQKNIYAEIESSSAITYYTHFVKKPFAMAYKINFVKYVDEQGNEDYWFRLVSEPKVRFLYYLDIQVDDTIYKLLEIKNPNHSQLHASAYSSNSTYWNFFSLYRIPNEIIEKIKNTNKPITFFVNKQTRQNFPINSTMDYTNTIKEIIKLDYSNKDEYWKPNI